VRTPADQPLVLQPVELVAERSRRHDICATVGRDPAAIARSTQLIPAYDDPAATRETVPRLVDVGINHVVVNLLMPFPHGVARWVADEIIRPIRAARLGQRLPGDARRRRLRPTATAELDHTDRGT
jgi:hypothetical protein